METNEPKPESDDAYSEITDRGGTRSGDERRTHGDTYDGADRRSGKDRRRGFDRRTGLPRRRQPDRRNDNRYYWNGTAVERRDAFRKG